MSAKVILRQCDSYDPNLISRIVLEGLDELDVHPRGRTLIKPNAVIAHPKYFAHAFTRSEFLDGVLAAVRQRDEAITDLTVGERCGITIPTRYSFANTKYPAVIRKHGAHTAYFDEELQVERRLLNPHALRESIYIPQTVARAEFMINLPKLKAHPWTKMTCALKNYIGIQDDRHRLIDHDFGLNHKIVDLQEVIHSDFIAVDAIIAGQKTMLTPIPFKLNLIVMGTNSVALDAIAARILGLNPVEVDHLRLAYERHLGPIDLSEIEVSGDVSLEEAIDRARGFGLTLDRVEEIFNGRSNIQTHVGRSPMTEGDGYCWGGCPGSLFEAMQVIQAMQPNVYREVKPMHFVFGDYRGSIEAKANEPVVFMGDCAQFDGTIKGHKITIESRYIHRQHLQPAQAKSSDVVSKMITSFINRIRHTGQPAVRVKGCPVSVAENALYLSMLGGTKNPYLSPDIAVSFIYHYLIARLARWWKTGPGAKSIETLPIPESDQTAA